MAHDHNSRYFLNSFNNKASTIFSPVVNVSKLYKVKCQDHKHVFYYLQNVFKNKNTPLASDKILPVHHVFWQFFTQVL